MEAKTTKFSCNFLTILFSFLFFLLIFPTIQTTQAASETIPTCTRTTKATYKVFLKRHCNSTTYPSLCYNSLSSYTSKIKTNSLTLTTAALYLTLKSAQECSSLVSTLAKSKERSKTEKAVVRDCKEEMGDSIDELKKSLTALWNLKRSTDRQFDIANIKTWVSAAITDEDTCSDEFQDMNVSSSFKNKMKKCVSGLARMTSNSLALVNHIYY